MVFIGDVVLFITVPFDRLYTEDDLMELNYESKTQS